MSQKELLRTSAANFEKFHAWLDVKYKPSELFTRVYAEQDGDILRISHCWSYGSVKQETPVCVLPLYPIFDPEFDAEKFYSDAIPASRAVLA
mgnify:CR=1 FL=1